MGNKIEGLWCFISVDEEGNEGLIAQLVDDMWVPFICADKTRMEELLPIARRIARIAGMTIELRYFGRGTTMEVIHADVDHLPSMPQNVVPPR